MHTHVYSSLNVHVLYIYMYVLIPSRAVGGVPTSVFYPVLTWLLLIVLFIYWAVVAVYPIPHIYMYMYICCTSYVYSTLAQERKSS